VPSIRIPLTIHKSHRWISPLPWEPCCVVCNAPAQGVATASLVSINRIFIFLPLGAISRSDQFSISYPVCLQHRKWCNLLDWPARRGIILAFLCWLFAPGLLLLAGEIGIASLPSDLPNHLRFLVPILAILLWGGMTVWYTGALFLKPVRLSNLSSKHVTVTIKNKIVFQHIQGLNSNHILSGG
jgi:hypothetical protein